MKNSYKVALLAALGIISATSGYAQYADGDLLLGFTSTGANKDYTFDLGQISSFTANEQLGSGISWSVFSSAFGANNVAVGAVGADTTGNVDPSGGQTIWTSVLRSTQPVTSSGVAGSSTPSATSQLAMDAQTGDPGGVTQNPAVTQNGGTVVGNTWGDLIATGVGTPGTLGSSWASGIHNPMVALGTGSAGGAVNLDIYTATDDNNVNTYTYAGDLQINITSSGASVIWDPTLAAVPEPTTYGLLAGFGLLAVALRNQFSRKNA
jgi:hypothetical protein